MKACCYVCKEKKEGTQEQLTELGWQGAEGEINGNKYKFELCPAHSDAKTMISIFYKVQRREKVFRNTEGEYG